MLSLGLVVLGVTDMERAIAFWTAALDYRPHPVDASPTWTTVEPVGGGPGAPLGLELSVSPIEDHPRMHLDLHVADAAEQAAESARLQSLGATVVDWDLYPADPDFVVLADTEGNKFCIVDLSHG